MEAKYSETKAYSQWCYENTATILSDKFKDAGIWMMTPSRMLRNIFSCYSQFVQSSLVGVPFYKGSYGGIPNLQHLLVKAISCIHNIGLHEATLEGRSIEAIAHLPVVLVGFSKGCVVLNQFLYEIMYFTRGEDLSCSGECEVSDDSMHTCKHSFLKQHTRGEKAMEDVNLFIKGITDMFWLDSGHSGAVGAWVNNGALLENLVATKIRIHVHVTPYQVHCPSRPWIGEEERYFVDTLKQLNIDVTEQLHFEDKESSLENHFKVLEEFNN